MLSKIPVGDHAPAALGINEKVLGSMPSLQMEYKPNYTYVLECRDKTLYTGWTNNLDKRIKAHNEGRGAKYTKPRRPVKLLYYETFPSKEEAMRRECEIKRMSRKEKLELIRGQVPKKGNA